MTASEVEARGIQNRELANAVNRGELVKTARGLYCTPETWEDEYVRAQHRFARGIFSHDTALYLLGLSDSAPESLAMTFPRGYNPSSAKKSGIITKSSPAELHELGCIELGTPLATSCVPITPNVPYAICCAARRRPTSNCFRRHFARICHREKRTCQNCNRTPKRLESPPK